MMLLYKIAKETAICLVLFYALDAFYDWHIPEWSWADLRFWVLVSMLVAFIVVKRE